MKLEFVEVAGFRGFRDKTRFEIPSGFVVLVGRNGAGKSTVLDAIDYALTGTINKFDVKTAKGGGLYDHIWWVGAGKAAEHYVSVGFIDANENRFELRRDRAGQYSNPADILAKLCLNGQSEVPTIETLMQTSLIRDERIVAFSLDLPEQQRFAAVRAAIGGIMGPDYSDRTAAIVRAAQGAKDEQARRFSEAQEEHGRSLTALTEARSVAERATDVAEALRIIESFKISLPAAPNERAPAVRGMIASRRQSLADLEEARQQAIAALPDHTYFNSPDGARDLATLEKASEEAAQELTRATEAADSSARLLQSEREADNFAAHLSALLEHGHAIGLQDGHCPLCDAARSQVEFAAALEAAQVRLSDRGTRLQSLSEALAKATAQQADAQQRLNTVQSQLQAALDRRTNAENELSSTQGTYVLNNFDGLADDPDGAQALILKEQEGLARLERALLILEASGAVERVQSIETRTATLKAQVEREAAKLSVAETANNTAKQIESAGRMVANEILTEQFDTVMPLLKELYRRLRPHAGWTEIESDFGGKIRGSLNFTVGDGHNVQFLFSSGQRRAAGLAFLLAIHLSRRWCGWQTLMLDDPVQHIDDYRALNLVEVLSAIRRTGRQIIVAVEDEALADVLCRRLRSLPNEIGRCYTLRTSKTGTGEIASARDIYPMPREILRSATAS